MADALGINSFHISDPTTASQQAGVDASGNLKTILAANSGIDIGDVDVTSIFPGTGATNLGKAEDAAHTGGDVGVMTLAKRTDTAPAATSGTDGDYEPLQVFGGRLWVTALIDTALPAGANAIGKLAANSGVDIGDVDVTSVIAGVGATNLGKAEDAVHGSGDTGVYVLAVRDDSLAAHSGTDGDYESLHTNASGALWVAGNGTFTVLDATVGTNTTDLPNVIGTDGAAGPSKAVSVAGTESGGTLQEVRVDSDGHLQVDVLSGGGSTAPTNPVIDITNITTPVSVAGNLGTGNLNSADVSTKKLRQVCVWGSRKFKVVISTLSGGVATAKAIGGSDGGGPFVWEPPHENFAVCGTTVGGFRAAVTNLDPVDATDFYASFAYND